MKFLFVDVPLYVIKWVQWGWVKNISKFYVNAVILFACQALLPTNSIRGLNVSTSSYRPLGSYLNKEPSPPMIGVRSNTIKEGVWHALPPIDF